jgi:hypothetical protein
MTYPDNRIAEFTYVRTATVEEIRDLLEEEGYPVWVMPGSMDLGLYISAAALEEVRKTNPLLKNHFIGYLPHPGHYHPYNPARVRTFIYNNFLDEKPLFTYNVEDDETAEDYEGYVEEHYYRDQSVYGI